jgi:xanthine dehydrogenase YagR molybdenum-binding subunit
MFYSTIANGRTVSIDTAAAGKAPGVLAVFTHHNMPRMNPLPWSHLRPQGQTYLPLQDDRIHYAGQPVALVVAATLDQATYAGTLIRVAYEAQAPVVFDLRTAREDAVEPPQRMWPLSSSVGNADQAIAPTPRSRSTRSTPCPTGITIRWSRTRPWRPGMMPAR